MFLVDGEGFCCSKLLDVIYIMDFYLQSSFFFSIDDFFLDIVRLDVLHVAQGIRYCLSPVIYILQLKIRYVFFVSVYFTP
jgi:hypothetical protein